MGGGAGGSVKGKSEQEVKTIILFVPFPVDFSATVVNRVYILFVSNLLFPFLTSKSLI